MSAKEITLSHLSKEKTSVIDGIMLYNGASDEFQYHDFFEISLVLEGRAHSNINGDKMLLERGVLIIIRPYDVHYKEIQNGDIVNFGISVDAINALFSYFGDKFNRKKIVWTKSSPIVVLTDKDIEYFKNRIDQVQRQIKENYYLVFIELRVILMELLLKFAPWAYINEKDQVPLWLKDTLAKLERKEFFTEGLPALLRITGKSQSYLCRVIKKHYNLTPTQYINQARLKYAAFLLSTTDIDILLLAETVGFESLSHFYHCFKKFYGISPKVYQKIKWTDLGDDVTS